eukprot:3373156-Rhodomonas_salina.1
MIDTSGETCPVRPFCTSMEKPTGSDATRSRTNNILSVPVVRFHAADLRNGPDVQPETTEMQESPHGPGVPSVSVPVRPLTITSIPVEPSKCSREMREKKSVFISPGFVVF